MNDLQIQPVFDAPEISTPLPKVRWYHWVIYYLYNYSRRPLVILRKRELIRIADSVQKSLKLTLLPSLRKTKADCQSCQDAYVALNGQTFVSIIQMITERLACDDHHEMFVNFRVKNEWEFQRSEQIAAWINGTNR